MVKEGDPQKAVTEPVSLEINRFFQAIPGKTKEVRVMWHDYEDERSLEKIIHIPVDQDPETGATGFLMEYVPGMYDFESVKERWIVQIYPVREGPGSGDGSDDVIFGYALVEGTEEEALEKSRQMKREFEEDHGSWNSDLGSYEVGSQVLRRS
jgi:hypothetical protein